MSQEKRLRFRIRTRDQEIELEGDFEYVRDKFENLVENLRLKDGIVSTRPEPVQTLEASEPSDLLKGIVQFSGEGRPYLTVPADSLSAKEPLTLISRVAQYRLTKQDAVVHEGTESARCTIYCDALC